MWDSPIVKLLVVLLLSTVLYLATLASIRLAFAPSLKAPSSALWRRLSSPWWCLAFVLEVPILVGEFARGESSPLPWATFAMEASRNGIYSGIFAAIAVIGADLWLLWIPAHYAILRNPGRDDQWKWMLRGLNLVGGLLIMMPNNPVYWLIDHL